MKRQIKTAGAVPLYLKMLLYGERHSGKTYTGLGLSSLFTTWLGSRLLVIDADPIANNGEAASAVAYYGSKWAFDYLPLGLDAHPRSFIEAIQTGIEAGYQVIMIDGLEQAWVGQAGLLSTVSDYAQSDLKGNTFAAWKMGTQEQDAMIRAIELAHVHIFATCVAKPKSEQSGKEVTSKGVLPLQRPGFEYQWMLACRMNRDHSLRIVASKLGDDFAPGVAYATPGRKLAAQLLKRVTHLSLTVEEVTSATTQIVTGHKQTTPAPTTRQQPDPAPEPEYGDAGFGFDAGKLDVDVLPEEFDIVPTWTYITKVDVVANRSNAGNRYVLHTKLGKLNVFTASKIRDAGWISQDAWRDLGAYTPSPDIPVRVQKRHGGHLELLEVEPADTPADTPNGSESGEMAS